MRYPYSCITCIHQYFHTKSFYSSPNTLQPFSEHFRFELKNFFVAILFVYCLSHWLRDINLLNISIFNISIFQTVSLHRFHAHYMFYFTLFQRVILHNKINTFCFVMVLKEVSFKFLKFIHSESKLIWIYPVLKVLSFTTHCMRAQTLYCKPCNTCNRSKTHSMRCLFSPLFYSIFSISVL